jgi:hypothetical protein
MKLAGKCSESRIDLGGDRASLHELAQAIRELRDVREWPLNVPASTEVQPDHGILVMLKIRITSGKVRISLDKRQITIMGSTEKLSTLAQNIEFCANNAGSNHQHIEFHPAHFFLEPDSIPLVVTRLE